MIRHGDYEVNKQVFTKHGLGRIESINDNPTGLVTFNVNVKNTVYCLSYNEINIKDIFTMNDTIQQIPDNIKTILSFACKQSKEDVVYPYTVEHILELCDGALINIESDVIRTIQYVERVLKTIQNVDSQYIFKKVKTPIRIENNIAMVFRHHIDNDGSYNHAKTVINKIKKCAEDLDPKAEVRMNGDVYHYIKKWATGKRSLTKWYCETARFLCYDMYSTREIDIEEFRKILDELKK